MNVRFPHHVILSIVKKEELVLLLTGKVRGILSFFLRIRVIPLNHMIYWYTLSVSIENILQQIYPFTTNRTARIPTKGLQSALHMHLLAMITTLECYDPVGHTDKNSPNV
jgi:hypothetical protein